MARLPRLSIPGELHLVLLRGHDGQPVFRDDEDRRLFLDALRDGVRQHGVQLHGYALLTDAVWLLATPGQPAALSAAVQALGRRYVANFNRRHGRSGTLWDGRYRAAVIEGERYFLPALVFLETAACRAGLAPVPRDWPWASAAHHLGARRDPLVSDHPLYWQLGNTPFDREAAYARALDAGIAEGAAAALTGACARSWALGSAPFLARLADRTSRPLGPRARGRPRKASGVD